MVTQLATDLLLTEIRDLPTEIRDRVVPLDDVSLIIRAVNITAITGATAQRGPDIPVHPAFKVAVRHRKPTSGTPIIYVAADKEDIKHTTQHSELHSEASVAEFMIKNMDELYFYTDTSGSIIEIAANVYRVH